MKQLNCQQLEITWEQVLAATVTIDKKFEQMGLKIGYGGTTIDSFIKELIDIYPWLPVKQIFIQTGLFLQQNTNPTDYLIENEFAKNHHIDWTVKNAPVSFYDQHLLSNKGLVFLHYLLCEYMRENMLYPELPYLGT